MKIEVDCFSLLHSAAGDSSGKLHFFHLFSENKDGGSSDSHFIIYGATARLMANEWLQGSIDQNKKAKQYKLR